jgi:hypothetical protein
VIRTQDHFVWNFTIFMAFLAVGFSAGFILGLIQPNSPLGALGRNLAHLGGEHILGNIASLFLIGLVLAVFAHPIEFVAFLASTVIVTTIIYQSLAVAGLSLVLFALARRFCSSWERSSR